MNAQDNYALQLRTGKFVPHENATTVLANRGSLKSYLFNGRYYLTLQFYQLPNSESRNILEREGVMLNNYLTGNAYAVVLPADFNFDVLKQLSLRSIFALDAHQKMSEELLSKKIPTWAIKNPGYVDVQVITYAPQLAEDVLSSIAPLKADILSMSIGATTIVLRVPVLNLKKVAALPFIQWVEPIEPPQQPER